MAAHDRWFLNIGLILTSASQLGTATTLSLLWAVIMLLLVLAIFYCYTKSAINKYFTVPGKLSRDQKDPEYFMLVVITPKENSSVPQRTHRWGEDLGDTPM